MLSLTFVFNALLCGWMKQSSVQTKTQSSSNIGWLITEIKGIEPSPSNNLKKGRERLKKLERRGQSSWVQPSLPSKMLLQKKSPWSVDNLIGGHTQPLIKVFSTHLRWEQYLFLSKIISDHCNPHIQISQQSCFNLRCLRDQLGHRTDPS